MKKTYLLILALVISFYAQAQTATEPSGDGSENNPYQIATLDNLYWLSQSTSIWGDNLYYIQTADIDASDTKNWNNGMGFNAVGSIAITFTGYYNGKGHVIKNLYINRPNSDYAGLFGATYNASLDSIGLENISISGRDCTGGLVGNAITTLITNCYTSGKVSGYANVGGLAGTNVSSSSILKCYSNCNVSVTSYCVGGLVGKNSSSTISDCYSTGNVTGLTSVGGLVGENSSTITYCYSSGKVLNYDYGGLVGKNTTTSSSITYCYWDTLSSGVSSGIWSDTHSQTVTGLTTSEMKQSGNFSGWDFSTIWAIRADSTYPVLRGVNNNAPFSFADTLSEKSSIDLTQLIDNDYDYETIQSQLVYKLISYPGSVSGDQYSFSSALEVNEADTIVYQVGELIAAGDTLWGNTATSLFFNTNYVPVITSTAPNTTTVDADYSYDVVATDGNGDDLTYTLSNAPEGMEIVNNSITWTPAEGTTTSGEITLTVSDGIASAIEKFTITVSGNTPVITSTAPTSASVGTEYTYTVTASDADDDALTYTLTNAPNGMSIAENVISWTPVSGTTSSGEVTLTVSDGTLNATEQFTIAVTEDNSNVAPEITSTAPTTATVGSEYTYTIFATDADGDALTYTLSNAPDGMSISDNVITWTPTTGTTTSGEVTLTVSDGSLSATEQFTITVSENSGTSVADVTTESIHLYPNPVSSALTVKSNSTIESLQLISVSGAVIRSEMVCNSEINLDMQNLQNGIYLLQINTSEGSITKKIVKQ